MSGHFVDGGADYARFRPTYPAALAATLADLAPPGSLALDVGCGTGQFARLLAGAGRAVLAVDVSADQLANAARARGVHYAAGAAERLPVGAGAAGLLVAAQAAHWFDRAAFRAEVRRVVVPGGAAALVTYGTPVLDAAVDPVFRHFYDAVIGRHWPPERRHVENGYAELTLPLPAVELPAFTIERRWPLDAFLGYVATFSAVKAARRAGEGAAVDAGLAELGRAWGEPAHPRRVTWPISVRAGRV